MQKMFLTVLATIILAIPAQAIITDSDAINKTIVEAEALLTRIAQTGNAGFEQMERLITFQADLVKHEEDLENQERSSLRIAKNAAERNNQAGQFMFLAQALQIYDLRDKVRELQAKLQQKQLEFIRVQKDACPQ